MARIALVTGASRGIGAAVARALAEDGLRVVVNYRSDADGAERTVGAIRAAGGDAVAHAFDVRNAAETRDAVGAIARDVGPIAVLVNNAGIARDQPFPAMSQADWDDVVRTKLDGFFNTTQPLTMPMVRARWGRIINVSSVSGVIGNRGQVNYSAASAALIGATKALAQELAKRQVTVNAVAPGLIETDMIAGAPVAEIVRHIPMRRIGRPEEVADLVRFLASDRAAYITGQVIGINGGLA